MKNIDFTKAIAEAKGLVKDAKKSQADAKKILDMMKKGREQQKAIDYPRFEKMFAKAVRDLEQLVASQDVLAKAGSEAVTSFTLASKAWKKCSDAAAKTKKNAEKARATVEKIHKIATN